MLINNGIKFSSVRINLSSNQIYYVLAFLIRVCFAIFFVDRQDFATFSATGYDIIVLHTSIYNSESLHRKFRYFPLAYIAVLPGQMLYYNQPFRDVRLQRLFLKLPLIFGDLWLAKMFRNIPPNSEETDGSRDNQKISALELFILFNPILIYAGSIKGQFDIIPGILVLYAWRNYRNEKHFVSGIFSGLAFMFKQYTLIFSYYLFLLNLTKPLSNLVKLTIGFIIITVPTIIFAILMNRDGFLEGAILYHLHRTPDGYSLFGLFLKFLKYHTDVNYIPLISILNLIGTIIIATVALSYGFRLLRKSESRDQDAIRFFLITFTWFITLKIFLIHYLAGVIPIWIEYTKDKDTKFNALRNNWSFSLIPLVISFRVSQMTPIDTRLLFGNYWVYWIWSLGIVLHLIIVLFCVNSRSELYPHFKYRLFHVILLLGLSIQLLYV